MRTPLPSLEGAAAWVNGEPTPQDLEGHPLVVQFWSISCHLCHETADQVAAWRAQFEPRGVKFVSIHQPRSAEELDVEKVTADSKESMSISGPLAIDNAHTLVDRFANQFVPAFYVFDKAHNLRHFQAGDKGYDRIVAAIERVLSEEAA
jgi:thiol-disulfide isomerase/thioredoxin